MNTIIILFLTANFMLLYMIYEAFRNKVVEKDLHLQGFPSAFNGLRLYFISDIHWRKVSLSMVEQLKGKVDLMVIGGDLAEKRVPYERIEHNLRLLASVAPVFFVWGNNDYELDVQKLDACIRGAGIRQLVNETVCFKKNGDNLLFVGVDDHTQDRDRLDQALKGTGEGYRILLTHNPDIIQNIKTKHQIGLILSGHTHGGQIRIFGWGLREKGGIKQVGESVLVISNGYGTTTLPLRLGAPAETHLFTLYSKTSA
nr:metallophosphoesterase [Pseudalkalibacillus caeni]